MCGTAGDQSATACVASRGGVAVTHGTQHSRRQARGGGGVKDEVLGSHKAAAREGRCFRLGMHVDNGGVAAGIGMTSTTAGIW
jgi:hypothetical protein